MGGRSGHYCSTCGDNLILGDNWTCGCKNNSTYICRSCRATYQREYHSKNREERLLKQKKRYIENREDILEKQKYYNINKKYKLSKEEYHDLIDNAVCSICAVDNDLVIDHNHKTGTVRGVLCRSCNCGLGSFKDEVQLLEKAKEYVHNGNE